MIRKEYHNLKHIIPVKYYPSRLMVSLPMECNHQLSAENEEHFSFKQTCRYRPFRKTNTHKKKTYLIIPPFTLPFCGSVPVQKRSWMISCLCGCAETRALYCVTWGQSIEATTCMHSTKIMPIASQQLHSTNDLKFHLNQRINSTIAVRERNWQLQSMPRSPPLAQDG